LADAQTAANETIRIFGARSTAGVPASVDRVEYADATDQIAYDFDGQQRLVGVQSADGTHASFQWSGTAVDAVVTTPEGDRFSLPVLAALPSSDAPHLTPPTPQLAATLPAGVRVTRCNQTSDAEVYLDVFDASTGVVARRQWATRVSEGNY